MPHTHHTPLPRVDGRRPILARIESSRYLSPIQEQRILTWRDQADSAVIPLPPKTKSAPASLSLSKAASSSTCTCGCTSCSCSTKSPPSKSSRQKSRQKSYYSGTKKKSGSTTVNSAPPVTPITPITPAGPTTPHQLDHRGLPPPPTQHVLTPQDSAGGLPAQYNAAATVPLPERTMAAPAFKPDPSRIAGARDPVSQN